MRGVRYTDRALGLDQTVNKDLEVVQMRQNNVIRSYEYRGFFVQILKGAYNQVEWRIAKDDQLEGGVVETKEEAISWAEQKIRDHIFWQDYFSSRGIIKDALIEITISKAESAKDKALIGELVAALSEIACGEGAYGWQAHEYKQIASHAIARAKEAGHEGPRPHQSRLITTPKWVTM